MILFNYSIICEKENKKRRNKLIQMTLNILDISKETSND